MPWFELDDFSVSFLNPELPARQQNLDRTVDALGYAVEPGETLAIVGESGSGKSVSPLAATGLLSGDFRTEGTARFRGEDPLVRSARHRRAILGAEIGFVFQDPQSNLHPYKTVGRQIEEVIAQHTSLDGTARRRRVIDLLCEVGITDAEQTGAALPRSGRALLAGGEPHRERGRGMGAAVRDHPGVPLLAAGGELDLVEPRQRAGLSLAAGGRLMAGPRILPSRTQKRTLRQQMQM